MATLVLGASGAAIGSVFGGVGSIFGRAAGALAGFELDQALLGPEKRVEGPRLSDLDVQSSTEGLVIPRIYGKVRMAGQIIWATRFEEVRTEEDTETGGGKGGAPPETTTTVAYSYYANFAVALCEGPISGVGRIWADGVPLDKSRFVFRLHEGTEDQRPDPLIAAKETGPVPAYRGTAYVVFERMALAEFGNRIPQLTFELFRPLKGLEERMRAVCVIPGATEFGYDTRPLARLLGPGTQKSENAHAERNRSDWSVSIDELQTLCPNLEWATLIVGRFGDDLRAGQCRITPRVDDLTKELDEAAWSVAGLTREAAQRVSLADGRPAFGGSPSDESMLLAIRDLKARGVKVALLPFVLMDVPGGNSLPDPWSGEVGQPAFPWRGRITCDPAPSRPGTADETAAADAQIAAFLGSAAPGDFAVTGDSVAYSGPDEWRYRRMVLHCASLAVAAGGVDAFLIGSEMRSLTSVRGADGAFPFVAGLRALAGDARAILGSGTKIGYAADWSEYFGHQPADGSGDVFFHLDPLWADQDIDFVGIDVYWPLADWRDTPGHADENEAGSIHDLDYLRANVSGGEGYDWFYASEEDRRRQVRTPISDGAYGKPWVFRFKDVEGWWSNLHYDRPGGVESATPTAWEPYSKPIWFAELGCPAVDKGANQPNVFYDPKSSESFLPHFLLGDRDDLMQRAYIEAMQSRFDPAHPRFDGRNPVSPVYGGRMVDPDHLHLWSWDARPYPYFPQRTDVWADGANWERGHWLNGRLGRGDLPALIAALLSDYGFADFDVEKVSGTLGGYVVNELVSARGALEPLLTAFGVDAVESGGTLRFRTRRPRPDRRVRRRDLVDEEGRPLVTRTRAQETELASEVVVRAIEPESQYHMAAAASRRLVGGSRRTLTLDLSAVLTLQEAEALADGVLRDIWAGRERLMFRLGPGMLDVEPGDVLAMEDVEAGLVLVERIEVRRPARSMPGRSRRAPGASRAAGDATGGPNWRPPSARRSSISWSFPPRRTPGTRRRRASPPSRSPGPAPWRSTAPWKGAASGTSRPCAPGRSSAGWRRRWRRGRSASSIAPIRRRWRSPAAH